MLQYTHDIRIGGIVILSVEISFHIGLVELCQVLLVDSHLNYILHVVLQVGQRMKWLVKESLFRRCGIVSRLKS